LEDGRRLHAKFERDRAPGGRRIDVVEDFAHKTFVEGEDGLRPLIPLADIVWDRGNRDLWVSRRAARPSRSRLSHL
jgi:hypothetical protein